MRQEGHITFKMVSESKSDSVKFQGSQISVVSLKELIQQKLGIQNEFQQQMQQQQHLGYRQQQLNQFQIIIRNQSTYEEYADQEKIRTNTMVLVERRSQTAEFSNQQCRHCKDTRQLQEQTCCFNPICVNCREKKKQIGKCPLCFTPNTQNYPKQSLLISEQELEIMASNAKFFVIRSSNQDNIDLAKQHERWATTRVNEARLNEAFQLSQNVIFFFRFHSKDQNFQGCARMESQSNIQDQSVNWIKPRQNMNLKLGGNFRIRWLRIGIITDQQKIFKMFNSITQNHVLQSRDCQEVGPIEGKQITLMFQHPPSHIKPLSQEQIQQIQMQQQAQQFNNSLNMFNNNLIPGNKDIDRYNTDGMNDMSFQQQQQIQYLQYLQQNQQNNNNSNNISSNINNTVKNEELEQIEQIKAEQGQNEDEQNIQEDEEKLYEEDVFNYSNLVSDFSDLERDLKEDELQQQKQNNDIKNEQNQEQLVNNQDDDNLSQNSKNQANIKTENDIDRNQNESDSNNYNSRKQSQSSESRSDKSSRDRKSKKEKKKKEKEKEKQKQQQQQQQSSMPFNPMFNPMVDIGRPQGLMGMPAGLPPNMPNMMIPPSFQFPGFDFQKINETILGKDKKKKKKDKKKEKKNKKKEKKERKSKRSRSNSRSRSRSRSRSNSR